MRKVTSLALILSVSMVAVFITGCSSISTNDGANTVEMKDLVMPKYKPVIKHETKKVSGNAQLHFLGIGPFGITWGSNCFAENTTFTGLGVSLGCKIKNAAVYDACENSRSDMLLSTKYKIKETNYVFYKSVSCTVSGFPAVITDVEEVKTKYNDFKIQCSGVAKATVSTQAKK